MAQAPSYTKTIRIQALAENVWLALTVPDLMQKWMLDEKIQIETDWIPGSAFALKGTLNNKPFENKGKVLIVEPFKVLSYTHLSSISELPDLPVNHTVYTFKLDPEGEQTSFTLVIHNFPTESIYKLLVFYWNVTLGILKTFIEKH